MSTKYIRRTAAPPARAELDLVHGMLVSLALLLNYSTLDDPGIANGTTAGTLKTTATAGFRIGTGSYSKAATDDLWDLSGETDTAAGEYRAYWLLLDSSGTASFAASGEQSSAALALADLPDLDGTKAVVGVFVADPACDFDDAGGLAAQGTIYDGIPEGASLGGDLAETYTAALPLVVRK